MNIGHILKTKGPTVIAIDDTAKLSDAVSELARRNIGSLVVKNSHGNVIGIISERDIIRVLHRQGREVLDSQIRQTMTSDPVSCSPDTTLDEALAQMTERRFRHLPVMRDRQLVGIVSIGDVVKAKIDETEREAEELRGYIAT